MRRLYGMVETTFAGQEKPWVGGQNGLSHFRRIFDRDDAPDMITAEQMIGWLNFVPQKSAYQHPRVLFAPPRPKKRSLRYPGEPKAHHKFWKDYRRFRTAWRNIMENCDYPHRNQFVFAGQKMRMRNEFFKGSIPAALDPHKFEWFFEQHVKGNDWKLICKIDIVPLLADTVLDPKRTNITTVLFSQFIMLWVQNQ